MPLFSCKACSAKDDEIRRLTTIVENLLTKVMAAPPSRQAPVGSPGGKMNEAPKRLPRIPIQTLPGYEPEYQEEVEVR